MMFCQQGEPPSEQVGVELFDPEYPMLLSQSAGISVLDMQAMGSSSPAGVE
jgi:hypothetical protein